MAQTTFSGPVVSQNGFADNSFTNAERDAIVNPQPGLLIYNTDTNTYQVYSGTAWDTAFGGGGGGGGFPYIISSFSSYAPAFNLGSSPAQPIVFTPGGLQAITIFNSAGYFYPVAATLSTPFGLGNVITVTSSAIGIYLSPNLKNIGSFFNPAGTLLTFLFGETPGPGTTGNVLFVTWSLSTPFDITTATGTTNGLAFPGTGLQDPISRAACLNSDGTKVIIVLGSYSNFETVICEVPLSTPYNIATAGPSTNYSFTSQIAALGGGSYRIFGLAFNPAGTVAFMQGMNSINQPFLIEFKLDTPYSLQSESDGFITSFYSGSASFQTQNSYGLTLIGNSEQLVFAYYDLSSMQPAYLTGVLVPLTVPNITNVSPSSGPVGTSVVIEGTGLVGTSSVTFGGVGASFGYMAPYLYTSVPSGVPTGVPLDVVVTNPAGSSTEVGAFTCTVSPAVTYNEGSDYSSGGVIAQSSYITLNTSAWFNGSFNTILSKPAGSAFTVFPSSLGQTYSGTLVSGFTDIGAGYYQAQINIPEIGGAPRPCNYITI